MSDSLLAAPPPPPVAPEPPALTAKRAAWLLVVYVLVQFIVGVIGAIVAGVYAAARHMPATRIAAFLSGDALFPISLAALVAGAAVVFSLVRRSYPGSLPFGALSSLGWIPSASPTALLAILGGVLLALVYIRLAVVLWPPAPSQHLRFVATAAATSKGWPKVVWALLLLVAPPIEEFLFRGALLTGFSRSFGFGAAASIVTVLFVACHLPETRLYYPAIASITALAVCTVVVRRRTGSLVPPICFHAGYNVAIALGAFASAA